MQVRDWLRPPRQLLVAFLAVALVSAAALGWLGWLLLEQDKALDVQRQRERIEQAADRAAAVLQRSLADLQSFVGREFAGDASPPPGVVTISLTPDGRVAAPQGSLLHVPVRGAVREAPPAAFSEGEQLEFSGSDLGGAARVYARLSAARNVSVRAGALVRLSRVRRKLRDPAGALQAYDQLAQIEGVNVGGLPATLVARVGRASVFSEMGRTSELRDEAGALQKDLLEARWPLVKSEYQFYATQAAEWLEMKPSWDAEALARAEAVDWLWHSRSGLEPSGRRSIAFPSGTALVAWSASQGRVRAMVAGPTYLAALASQAVAVDLRLTLSDEGGHVLSGEPAPARQAAIRPAAAAGLPWTLHVFAAPGNAATPPSARRRLLILAFAVVGLVLVAGWYFILRAIAREQRASRLQSDFVAAVSHEFRSPLTSMSHIAEMLASDRFPTEDLRRTSYDVLVRESDRLRRLVEGLLDFGRFESGAAALRIESVDVSELVRSTVADFQQRVAPEGYAIELGTPPAGVFADADREALSRALWNLLDNAVKYSPDCRTVWVEMERQSNDVAIVVRDRGLGIPLNEQREIFNRFVRGADSKARRIKGTGIGLAMVSQIVQAHGGEIRLTSEPGRGSSFTMLLHTAEGAA